MLKPVLGQGVPNSGIGVPNAPPSSIINGATPCTGCAAGGVLYNNGGVVTTDIGLTEAIGGTLTQTKTIAAVSTDGFVLQNTTPAAVGAQQWSPRLHFIGQGWKTATGGASQISDWIIEDQVAQGTANPAGVLAVSYQINGGGYINVFQISTTLSGGLITTPTNSAFNLNANSQSFTSAGNFASWNGGVIGWSSTSASTGTIDALFTRAGPANIQFGAANVNGAPVAQILSFQGALAGSATNQSSATTTVKGSLGTGTGTNGDIVFQTGTNTTTGTAQATATTAMTIKGETQQVVFASTDATSISTGSIQNPGGMSVNKRVWFNGISASAGLQTAVLCQSSGGEVIADSVACLASSARFKEGFGLISDQQLRDKTEHFTVKSWRYKRELGSVFPDRYYRERIGLVAEDVAAIDSRLVELDADGQARTIDFNAVLGLLAARMSKISVEFNEYKKNHP